MIAFPRPITVHHNGIMYTLASSADAVHLEFLLRHGLDDDAVALYGPHRDLGTFQRVAKASVFPFAVVVLLVVYVAALVAIFGR